MLIINKEHVGHVAQKIKASGISKETIDDVKKMLEIKEVLLWRADSSSYCGTRMRGITVSIENEVAILKDIVSALENNDKTSAVHLPEQYGSMIEQAGISSRGDTCPLPG
jgi:hypothetical protein